MAEIRNTFLKGRMNKDLDERLVPKGEYRDALNIEISTSEEDGVGTVSNVRGNVRVEDIVPLLTDQKCIGSIADESKNRLYWFVTSNDTDYIVEWNEELQKADFVFVDPNKKNKKATLKFGNTQITGINILDDFLFWTDDINEPRKINIKTCKQGTANINTHTRLFVNNQDLGDIQEEHITVIKKRPNKPLFTKLIHTSDSTKKSIFEKVFPRFSYRYKYVDGEYSAFGPFTNPAFSANHIEKRDSDSSYNTKHGYNTSMSNTIESIELMDFIPSDMPEDVVQVDLLYKREDSNVVYTLAQLKKLDQEFNAEGSGQGTRYSQTIDPTSITYDPLKQDRGAYLVTSENIFAAVNEVQLLRSWDNVPRKALSQEVTGNRIVYGNYTQGYDFYPDFAARVEAYYEARYLYKSDISVGGLQTIKSQRDYQVGVVFGDKYGRETPVLSSPGSSVIVPWEDANVSDGPNSLSPLVLGACLKTPIPDWADYYKFYIKETSGEYYNVLMDKVYLPSSAIDFENKEDHVWLAMPSSEINKVKEDDYLILKKTSSSKENIVSERNRYKIIDIKTEAPDAVSYVYLNVGELANDEDLSAVGNIPIALASGTTGLGVFPKIENRIDQITDEIKIDKAVWLGFNKSNIRATGTPGNSTAITQDDVQNVYISWKKIDGNGVFTYSQRYKAISINQDSTGVWNFKLAKKISIDDARLASINDNTDYEAGDTPTTSQLHPDLTFVVERKEKKDGEDFSGKFFVKILMDDILKSNLVNLKTTSSSNRFISKSKDIFWWADHNTSGYYMPDQVQNIPSYGTNPETQPQAIHLGTGITDTPTEWTSLFNNSGKTWFIDNMAMRAANLSSYGYAKDAGQGVKATEKTYGNANWNTEAATDSSLEPWAMDAETTMPTHTVNMSPYYDRVNSIPGIIEIDSTYIDGSHSWKKDIYTQETDETYGDTEGAFFMHLSFFAPGKDLHSGFDDDTLNNVDISGEDSIASLLQGVWGGGAFTTANAITLTGDSGQETKFIEFEGNYTNITEPLGESPGPNVGLGYDLEYLEQHQRQWDPTYSSNTTSTTEPDLIDEDLEEFILNLAIGKKFKFKQDANEEVYTILDISVKHIYNHTPWRAMWTQTGASTTVLEQNSVEEAATHWAQLKSDNAPTADIEAAAQTLCERIVNFGKAHNRRTCYILRLDKNPKDSAYNPVQGGASNLDFDTSNKIEFIDYKAQAQTGLVKNVSAIFETEPKDSLDLNIFYEAGQAIPARLTEETVNLFAPVGCRVEFVNNPSAKRGKKVVSGDVMLKYWTVNNDGRIVFRVEQADGNYNTNLGFNRYNTGNQEIDYVDSTVRFYRPDGSYTSCRLGPHDNAFVSPSGDYRYGFVINEVVDASLNTGINWYNAFTFGNGVESNRIEDSFNTMQLRNGARASTTLDEPYQEERRSHGLIYSGIYNAASGVNNLNQFIQAEKITKDLNPTYGSIQKLFSRRADLIAFCEDRVIKVLANKDAVFNADGNPNLVATPNVLGQATPFVGDYGISTNPESFSSESYRAYFVDKVRGSVLRLSMDGLTPISDAGMKDWFRDNLLEAGTILGSYDDFKSQYNITINKKVYNNVLNNSYINEGQELSISDYVSQIINAPNLEAGSNFTMPDINQEYEDSGEGVDNYNFLGNTTIIHWPAIPVGGISSYVVTTPAVYEDLVLPLYDDWTITNYGPIMVDPQDGTIQTNVGETVWEYQAELNWIEDFVYYPNMQQVQVGTEYNVLQQEVDAVLPTYGFNGGYMMRNDSGSSPLGSPNSNGSYDCNTHNTTYNFNHNGAVLETSDGLGYSGIYFTGNNMNLQFPYSVGGVDDTIVPSAIKTAYPLATNMSIFHGEEVFVKVVYRVVRYGGWYGGSAGEAPTGYRLKLNMSFGDGASMDASNFRASDNGSYAPWASYEPDNLWDGSGVDAGYASGNNPWSWYNGYFANTPPIGTVVEDNQASGSTYQEIVDEDYQTSTGTGIVSAYSGTDSVVFGWDFNNYDSMIAGGAANAWSNISEPENNTGAINFFGGSSAQQGTYAPRLTDELTALVNVRFNANTSTVNSGLAGPGMYGPKSPDGIGPPIIDSLNIKIEGNSGLGTVAGSNGAFGSGVLITKLAIYKRYEAQALGSWHIGEVGATSPVYEVQDVGGQTIDESYWEGGDVEVAAPAEFEYGVLPLVDIQVYDDDTGYGTSQFSVGTLSSVTGGYYIDENGVEQYTPGSGTATTQDEAYVVNPGNIQTGTQTIVDGTLVDAAYDTTYQYPETEIPSWIEVTHGLPNHWSLTSGNDNALNYTALQAYGPENPGTWESIPSDFTSQDSSLPTTYYVGSNNGVLDIFNAPGGTTNITTYDGNSLAAFNGGTGASTPATSVDIFTNNTVVMDGVSNNTGNGVSSYLVQDLSTPLIAGNYYMVDLGYDSSNVTFGGGAEFTHVNESGNGTVRIQGCIDTSVATAASGLTHLSALPNLYPAGHFGSIHLNTTTGDIRFMPTVATEYGAQRDVLRVVFQASNNAYHPLDALNIQVWGSQLDVQDVTIIDVTSTGYGGSFNNYWNVGQIGAPVTSFGTPKSYYQNGGWVWKVPNNDPLGGHSYFIEYPFDNNELMNPTGQGYSFSFNIANEPETGSVEGILQIDVVTTANSNGDFYQYTITPDAIGTYELSFNLDGSGVLTQNPGNATTVTIQAHNTSSVANTPRIIARPKTLAGFFGKLTSVSIIDETSIISGGNSNTWTFTYYNSQTNDIDILEPSNEVQFLNGVIALDNAIVGTQISQTLDQDIVTGQQFDVLFDTINVDTSQPFEVAVYYFSEPGVGFYQTQQITEDGTITIEANIVDNIVEYNSSEHTLGNIVIAIIGTTNATVDLDNIMMIQVDNSNLIPKTISYSENVKGWVSFKSYIPESAVSLSKKYFTIKEGRLYAHGELASSYNNFYDVAYNSTITTIFNDVSDVVKTFRTIAYEGTQSKVEAQSTGGLDAENWNLLPKDGWACSSISTDIESGLISEFIKKEGKWFNYIKGNSLQIEDLSFQGLGVALSSVQVTEEEGMVDD